MKKKGSEIIIHILETLGVETVAGIPGSSILPLYDALSKSSIKHIAVRQEQAAGFLAEGIARSTGKIAVCLATSGPGAMNLLTAIADAKSDSIPIIAITGQVNSALIGTDAFQEVDTFGLSFPITKHSFMVKKAADLFTVIPTAFKIAKSGRPGPVLIDVPCDVQNEIVQFDDWIALDSPLSATNPASSDNALEIPAKRHNAFFFTPPSEYTAQIEKILQLLMKAEKPLLLVGGGCNSKEAATEIRKFVDAYKIPVAATLMGLGVLPKSSEFFVGMIGIHGNDSANAAVHNCDLLIAVGTRFDERARGIKVGCIDKNPKSTFCPNAKIVHIDIDAAEVNKILESDVSIVADAKSVFPILTKSILEKKNNSSSGLASDGSCLWFMDKTDKIDNEKFSETEKKPPKHPISPRDFISSIPDIAEKHGIRKSDIIVTTDVGQHQMWAAKYYPIEEPQTFLTSGSLGTMGFGLPAAIGAAIANPVKHIICFSGDGSILMNIQEFATLQDLGLPITIFIFQNNAYGLVRQQQKYFFKEKYSASLFASKIDFISIAKGFGINAVNASDCNWEDVAFGKPSEETDCEGENAIAQKNETSENARIAENKDMAKSTKNIEIAGVAENKEMAETAKNNETTKTSESTDMTDMTKNTQNAKTEKNGKRRPCVVIVETDQNEEV